MRARRATLVRGCVIVGALALLGASCSDSSGSSAPSTTLVRATTSTTLVPETPDQTGSPQLSPSTTQAQETVGFLSAAALFPNIGLVNPALSLRALAAGDLDRLEARFRQDERVDVFLEQVDARGVYSNNELVAVAVSVAVSPGAAGSAGFIESFVAGATEGGVVNPTPVQVLDEELTSWLSENTGHILWSYENLFLIVSGRDPILVRDISEAIVTLVIAPSPPPTTLPVALPCPPEGETDTEETPTDSSTTEAVDPGAEDPVAEDPADVDPDAVTTIDPTIDCVPQATSEQSETTEGE